MMYIGISLILCSLVYSLFVFTIFFIKKHIKSVETNIYSVLLISNILNLVLELCCFATISHSSSIPVLAAIASRLFLVSLLTWNITFSMYIFNVALSSDEGKIILKRLNIFEKVLMIISIIMILICPLYYFYENNVMYSYGQSTDFVTLVFGINLILSLIVGIKNIKVISLKKISPLFLFVVLMGVCIGIRLIEPGLNILSCIMAFVTLFMYFTIENPDVKMLRKMELAKMQAERANSAKSDFLSSMSHEIRTPLNAIVGLSEDIATFKGDVPDQVVEDTDDILNASQTLLEIVGNILDINKIESNKMEIIDNPYNFKEEIKNMCKVTATRIGEKPLNFKLEMADDIPYEVIGDKGKVKEVVNNLLTNSIKYTDEGEVNLSVKCINQDDISNLIITCRDTGKGIKAEDINKLFTKFERLDAPKNSTVEGTGLGLAITKKLVEMMGGKINVQSQFGHGSIFVVQIPQKISKMVNPLTNTQTLNLNEIRKRELENASYGNKKILIVDDNELNIKVAKRALADFNFEIDQCYNGLECLEKVKNGDEYDLILMDIMMPEMSGETAMEKLKENPNFNIPTIALTADAMAGAEDKYKTEGFTSYIAKPFNKEQIKERLDLVFQSNSSEDRFKDAPTVTYENGEVDTSFTEKLA